jgi:prolyl-tRNA synthetase
MMGDKRALQAGTSHYLGQNFARAFDVKFQNEKNQEEFVYATSWGVSTRLVGALIMVHGDEKGLRLPPKIAPIQTVIIPIIKNENSMTEIRKFLQPLLNGFENNDVRYHIDDRVKVSPGFKYNEWEMKGVPVRLEVGSRDMKSGSVFVARRDTGEKKTMDVALAADNIVELLEEIQSNLFQQAKIFREENTFTVESFDEFKSILDKGGFIRCGWDGCSDSEAAVKSETKATIRCILSNNTSQVKNCVYSGNPATYEVIYAKAY